MSVKTNVMVPVGGGGMGGKFQSNLQQLKRKIARSQRRDRTDRSFRYWLNVGGVTRAAGSLWGWGHRCKRSHYRLFLSSAGNNSGFWAFCLLWELRITRPFQNMLPIAQRHFRTFIAAAFLLSACSKRPAATATAPAPPSAGASEAEPAPSPEALALFTKAVEARPTQYASQLNLANCQLGADQAEAAIESADAALHLDPYAAAAYYVRGCANLRLGRAAEAVKDLQQSARLEPAVAAVHFQLAQAHLALSQNTDATAEFRETARLEPEHRGAYRGLAQALGPAGKTEEASKALARNLEVNAGRKPGPGDTRLFETCAHTEVVVAKQDADEPAADGIPVAFVDASGDFLGGKLLRGPAAIIDPAANFQPGLIAFDTLGIRVLKNTGGKLATTGDALPALAGATYRACLAADLSHNRETGAVLLSDKGTQLLGIAANGALRDLTPATRFSALAARAGVLVDFDFAGRLGLAAVTMEGTVKLFRHDPAGTFTDVTAQTPAFAALRGATEIIAEDWDGDDRIDLCIARKLDPPFLHECKPRAANPGAETPDAWPVVGTMTTADLDNDFHTDLIASTEDGIECFYGGGKRRVMLAAGAQKVGSIVCIDFDNDGWPDVFTAGEDGVRAWRNLGPAGFREVTETLGLEQRAAIKVQGADFDNDGDTDLLVELATHELRILRNDGGNANLQMKFRLTGKHSNASGLGTRIELRAGGWRTLRTVSTLPVEIGVGQHPQLDSVRLHWPDALAEINGVKTAAAKPLVLAEPDLRAASSPNLYAWDGKQFHFITDLLSAAPLGLPRGDGQTVAADSEELIPIGNDVSIPPKDGAFSIAITSEMRGVFYLDEAKLLVVDHPPGTEVHSTSKLLPESPFPAAELVPLSGRRALLSARRSDGRDVTFPAKENDGKMIAPVDDHATAAGLVEPWSIDLDFGRIDTAPAPVLVLTGWLRAAAGAASIAAAGEPESPSPFPQLEAETGEGHWQKVDVAVGAPSGKMKTILVDLDGKIPRGTRRLRLSTALAIYWDRIALFSRDRALPHTTTLSAPRADLHWRGFGESEPVAADQPPAPSYDRVQETAPWHRTPSGWFTRYGDVRRLLGERDEALALLAGGDEITLNFPTGKMPPKQAGWTRSLFLRSAGWWKSADDRSAFAWTVDPLPFRGMDDQRYGREPRPWFPTNDLMRDFTTRWIGPLTLSHQTPSH